MKTVIVRYGELSLKSKPVRRNLEDSLIKAIRLVAGKRKYLIRRERGRIFIDCRKAEFLARRIAKLPGVTSVSPAIVTSANIDEMIEVALKVTSKFLGPGKSFAIRATRTGKHEFTSMDVCSRIGKAVLESFPGTSVDLSSPDFEINVEVRGNRAYIYTETLQGTGGLPTGSQGKIVVLMRGYLRDALVAYLMMKRGAVVIPAFVRRGEKSDAVAIKKVRGHVKRLRMVDPNLVLRVIEGKHKKDLLKTVESFASKIGAPALATGDTLKGMRRFPRMELPHLLPLAGLEDEIPALLKKSGLGFHF